MSYPPLLWTILWGVDSSRVIFEMDPNLILRLFACLALLLLTEPLLATDLTGKVVGVHDGDTLTLLV